jgi:protein-S-isoprenylcysteine O-methyltransferase Ste14
MIALKTLIFTIVVPGTAAVYIPYLLLSSGLRPLALELGAFRLLGLAPLALGVLIYLWCAWDFTFAGRGTPAPIAPPQTLVVRGLYRFVRNPMYVGVLLVVLGEAIVLESALLLLYGVLLFVIFHLFVLSYEEPALQRQFGMSYEQYRNAIPRWLPNLRSPKSRISRIRH